MRSEYDVTKKRYDIGPIDLRRKRAIPDNVSYKYTVATTKPNGKLKDLCEPLDPIIRVLR